MPPTIQMTSVQSQHAVALFVCGLITAFLKDVVSKERSISSFIMYVLAKMCLVKLCERRLLISTHFYRDDIA